MYIPAFRFIQKHAWVTALATTGLLFILLNIISTPLLNSGDDAFLMYTLAGGYGESPTQLLHYNYGWHPWLGTIVKNLFVTLPGVNWYTIFLLLFHVAGCVLICYVLLKRLKVPVAFFFFSVCFFFIETRLLMSLTFTGAAFVAAIGAGSLLLHQLQQKKLISINTAFALLLLILAGMLRLQILWLAVFLFAPATLTTLSKKEFLKWTTGLLVIVLILFGLNKIHEKYYIKHIEGWQQQEKLRQSLFYVYNRPIKTSSIATAFTSNTEQELFFSGFLYDSVRFTAERIKAISKKIIRQRWMADKNDRQAIYWVFVEMRIYILLFGTVIFSLLLQRKYVLVKKWFFSFLTVAGIYTYLFVFLKITTTIHLGLLMVLWMHLALHFRQDISIFSQKKTIITCLVFILLLLFGWMSIRVLKENKTNLKKRQKFLCAITELNRSPQNLFVETDDTFPMSYFYIWDTPKQFPVRNLLYKDRFLSHTYLYTLKRFGITNLESALLHNKNVFLLGSFLPAVTTIYPAVKVEGPFPSYRCLEVRQLREDK